LCPLVMAEVSNCPLEVHVEMDPFNDIYYCYRCEQNHKCKPEDSLKNAVRFLYVDRVKQIIENQTEENGILGYVLRSNMTLPSTREKFLCVDMISTVNFQEGSIFQKMINPQQKKAMELYCQILNLIASKFPSSITERIIESQSSQRTTKIVEILTNHYIEPPGKEACCICFSSHGSSYLIDNTCFCKTKIHVECLIKSVRKLGDKCKTCTHSYGSVVDSQGRLLFPFKDIYKLPLINQYVIATDTNLKLHYAIAYLQTDRMSDILMGFSSEDYFSYLQSADTYALHCRPDPNGPLKLLNTPYTNFSRNKCPEKFADVERMLEQVHKKFTTPQN